jgi:uncharacterized YccA/Bax inhibitor family protein
MSNPVLNDRTFDRMAQGPGWAAPDPRTRATPIDDGPRSPWQSTAESMTINGTMSATGVLMVLLLASAAVGWSQVDDVSSSFPPLAFVGIAVGLGATIALMFKPMWARVLAPIYAVAQGFFVGAVSKAYEKAYDGIVISAVGATLGVALVMLVLYRTRIIKVTQRFKRIVIMATMGLMAFYLVTFVLSLFDINIGAFRNDASPLGIVFSLFAAGLAAMNLALDYDFIENGVKQRLPKGMEWVAAFGLLVTLVWLYLELLRLLSKLHNR